MTTTASPVTDGQITLSARDVVSVQITVSQDFVRVLADGFCLLKVKKPREVEVFDCRQPELAMGL